jgi:hypothetical protein
MQPCPLVSLRHLTWCIAWTSRAPSLPRVDLPLLPAQPGRPNRAAAGSVCCQGDIIVVSSLYYSSLCTFPLPFTRPFQTPTIHSVLSKLRRLAVRSTSSFNLLRSTPHCRPPHPTDHVQRESAILHSLLSATRSSRDERGSQVSEQSRQTDLQSAAPSASPDAPAYHYTVKMTCSGCSGAITRVLTKNVEARE